jgi:hypothetical protein
MFASAIDIRVTEWPRGYNCHVYVIKFWQIIYRVTISYFVLLGGLANLMGVFIPLEFIINIAEYNNLSTRVTPAQSSNAFWGKYLALEFFKIFRYRNLH